jgi:hypothetical protein
LLSLSLQVPGNTIPDDALCNIGKLRTLEQLHLTSGYQSGTASPWDVDHDAILENLAGLSNLRNLALSRDAYPMSGYEHIATQAYYHAQITNQQSREANGTPEEDDALADSTQNDSDLYAGAHALLGHERLAEEFTENYDGHTSPVDLNDDDQPVSVEERQRQNIWEAEHTARMLNFARRYFSIFPQLRWFSCGQWQCRSREAGTIAVPTYRRPLVARSWITFIGNQ